MNIPKGNYRTAAGSEVEITGKYGGIVRIDFDRYEEDNCCMDCVVNLDFEEENGEYYLSWYCDYCDGGMAKLIKINGD